MGWQEILGGAFQGGVQGLGQIQDTRRQNAQLAIQQQNQQMQQQEAKRRAVMEAYQTLQGGQEVDPQQASQFKELGLGGLTAAPGGKIIKMKSPQEQQIELVLKQRQDEMDDKAKKDIVLAQIHNDGEGFFQKPPQERQSIWVGAGLDGDGWLTPQEKVKFSPQVAAAGIAAGPRYAAAGTTPLEAQKLSLQIKKQASDFALKLATDPFKGVDKEKYRIAYEDKFAELSGQPKTQSTGPAVGTRGKVGGVPAVWDGSHWVEE